MAVCLLRSQSVHTVLLACVEVEGVSTTLKKAVDVLIRLSSTLVTVLIFDTPQASVFRSH